MLSLVPVSLKDANAFVAAHHRRVGAKSAPFRFPLTRKTPLRSFAPPFPAANASLVCGWILFSFLDGGNKLEVTRLCTTGEKNACSMLYAAARAAKIWGPREVADFVGRGGARERTQFSPQAETELSGLCDDDGYRRIITYTLDTETGASIRAAGWTCMGRTGGKRWTGKRCPAVDLCPPQMKMRYEKLL